MFKKIIALMLALMLALLAPASLAETVEITDDVGATLSVRVPVERCIALDSSPYEVLSAFGRLDAVVGIHQSVVDNPLFPGLQELPLVATWSENNFEAIAEAQPQVCLSSVRSHGVITDNEALSAFDIADVKLDLRNPDAMRGDIALMGRLFDSEAKAAEIIAFYDKWEGFIAEREKDLAEADRVKVYVEYHGGAYKTGAPSSRFYSQVVLAGGVNIAKDLTVGDEPEVSAEWVATQNPDFIIREASGMGYAADSADAAKEIYDEILSREGLQMVDAIRNRNVHLIGIDAYSRPGYIVGVAYMAKWFYPDLFQDFEPRDVLAEYLELFHPGVELQGIWTYDE